MTDESDYAGTAPGEWTEVNSSADELFPDEETRHCEDCGDVIPEKPYVLSSPSDGRETLCMTCWGDGE